MQNRQTYLAGAFQRTMETSGGFNGAIVSGLLRDIEPAEVLAYGNKISQTSGGAATAAMGRILKPEAVSIVIVGDAAKFVDKLKAIRPNVEVVPAAQLDLASAAAAN